MTRKTPYLEVTFRHGKPLAAYFYLPRQTGDTAARTVPFEPGLLIDYAADGRPIGIEIVSPSLITLDSINRALSAVHLPPAVAEDLAPLKVA